MRDVPVCPQGRHKNGKDDHTGSHQAEGSISIRIEDAYRIHAIRPQEHAVGKQGHGKAAPPAEEIPEAHHRRPVVVVCRELGDERGVRYLKECDKDSDQDGQDDKIDEELSGHEPGGRIPEEEVRDPDRKDGQVHEGMPAAPAGMQPVGQAAHDRIGDRIKQEGDHDGKADRFLREPQNLVVVHEQEKGEPVLFDPIGHRAEAIEELG